MTTFILSFIKEFLSATKTKFYIHHKDVLGAFTLFFIIITGEIITPTVLGIPITKVIVLRMLGVATAGLFASLVSSKLVNKFLAKHQHRPYQFTIKFKDVETCEFVKMLLEEENIKTYINKSNKVLKAISMNRDDSKIIKETIEDKFKNYSVHEFVEYAKR